MTRKNKLLIIVASYSIIASLFVLFYYLKTIIFSFNEISLSELLVNLLMIFIFIALLITNIYLLFNKNQKIFSLKYNIIIYFLQIFHFKFLGLIYEFSSGIEIIAYFSANDSIYFGLKYDFWNILFTLFYRDSIQGFLIGVNLISVLLFISYQRIYKKINRAKTNEI
jgi:hypothetical protein